MGTAIKHPVADRVVEYPDVKNYNPVCHGMLYSSSCTHTAIVGVIGLTRQLNAISQLILLLNVNICWRII